MKRRNKENKIIVIMIIITVMIIIAIIINRSQVSKFHTHTHTERERERESKSDEMYYRINVLIFNKKTSRLRLIFGTFLCPLLVLPFHLFPGHTKEMQDEKERTKERETIRGTKECAKLAVSSEKQRKI